jgi:hypothetical protein
MEHVGMTSDHIDNRRLSAAVKQDVILEEAELSHLSTCEECLEMIRVLIRQNLSKSADA